MAEKSRSYWLNLFTGVTWQQFVDAGADVTGFRVSKWSQAQKIAVGDYMLCYLTRLSRFAGVLEVVGAPYKDTSGSIWEDDYPCRLPVRVVAQLSPETAVPISEVADQLSIFRDQRTPNAWTAKVRASPTLWGPTDGETVVAAIRHAESNPVSRPFQKHKLMPYPKGVFTKERRRRDSTSK